MTDQGGTVIQPGQGLFFNRRVAATSLLAFGEVRENAFVRPLAAGMSLVSGGYPVTQSATGTGSRELNLDPFFGSLDFATADSFSIWKADATQTLGPATYDTYWLLNRPSHEMVRWVKIGDVFANPREDELLFLRDRSVFQRAEDAIPTYGYPAPWSP